MPIYEYECLKCNHKFQLRQNFRDPAETVCPNCQGDIRKVITSPAIQFKGSGWYITDYARKNSPPASSKDSPVESKKPLATTNTTKD